MKWQLARELAAATEDNDAALRRRYSAYQLSVVLLVAGVATFAIALAIIPR